VLPYAISVLQRAGYKLVTVAECLGGLDSYRKVSEPQKPDVSSFKYSLLMLLTYLLPSLIGTVKYTESESPIQPSTISSTVSF